MDPKSKEFLNKKVLVTGASSGIGKACALYYLNEGAQVILCGRDEKTLKEIGIKFPDQAISVKIDLAIDMQIYDLKSSVIEICSGVDIVINCAGVMLDADTEKCFPQDYDYTIDVNLRSIFLMFRLFKVILKPGMSIVNVSCLYGTRPMQGCSAYAVSKAGVESFTRYAAVELAELGVRVNCVTAAPVDTNCYRFVGVSEGEYQEIKSRISKNIPMQRMANPDDIVKAITFFSSQRSGKVTGQVFKVDGGRALTISGYTPWRGIKNMNSRFEPDGVKKSVMEMFTGLFKKEQQEELKYPTNEEEIEKLINESNWSTRFSDAHEKILASYKNIEQNDKELMDKYTK